ncbi:MAG: transposase [Planctomycetaceae bacterium]
MSRPIVIGYHLIWTAYGWWLPNDPRGSGSRAIASDRIADLGEIHYGRREIQPAGAVVREFYEHAKDILSHPLLRFEPDEFADVADAFSDVIAEHRYTCYACAVMPDHVHLLIRKHKHTAEEMIENFQATSRASIIATGLREAGHPVWTRGGWKVFQDHPDAMRRTIAYIERNPTKDGLSAQEWAFVTEYDGWPLHPGHSPNSPYARRLRELRAR